MSRNSTVPQSPALLLVIVAAAIFVSETIIMVLLSALPPLPGPMGALIDSCLLIILLFPTLYFFIFRQSQIHIGELQKVNEDCQKEIAERGRVEEALRESERDLRYLSSQILSGLEKERKKVSRELHEELGQGLAVLKLRLALLEGELPTDPSGLRKEWEDILGYIDHILGNVRQISQDLSPYLLEYLGLSAALRRLIGNFVKRHPIRLTLDIGDIDGRVSPDGQIIIYRVFQEALANVEKHAQAGHLSVVIKGEDGGLSFLLEDDGKGFDLEKRAKKSVGLTAMEERVRMLGGTLDIWSQLGQGTRVSFKVRAGQDKN